MFATVIGIESLRCGGVDVVCNGEQIDGGAVWLPPGHWQPGFREKVQAAPHYAWALATAWTRIGRYGRALEGARRGAGPDGDVAHAGHPAE